MKIFKDNRGFYDPGWVFEFPALIIAIILILVGIHLFKGGTLIIAALCLVIGICLLLYWIYIFILDLNSSQSIDYDRLEPCPNCGSSLSPIAWFAGEKEDTLSCKCEKCSIYYNVTNYEAPVEDIKKRHLK